MGTMTNSSLVLMGMCLVFFGFAVGVIVSFLIWRLRFPNEASAPKKKQLSYTGDVRRTLGVLQQLQAMIGREAAEGDPGLIDLVQVIGSMQRAFGRNASLEGVIQALVAQDIDRQLAQRKRRRTQSTQDASEVVLRREVMA